MGGGGRATALIARRLGHPGARSAVRRVRSTTSAITSVQWRRPWASLRGRARGSARLASAPIGGSRDGARRDLARRRRPDDRRAGRSARTGCGLPAFGNARSRAAASRSKPCSSARPHVLIESRLSLRPIFARQRLARSSDRPQREVPPPDRRRPGLDLHGAAVIARDRAAAGAK